MSRYIDLGKFVNSGKTFRADLDIILRSNALVQANSGGGKSWELRRAIEQSFRRVPQIVIDPEGEFSTLREKFDFVLVGKGGDTPVDLRSAELLAHRLLKLGASAIIDLYETSKSARPLWVATFVQALVDAPKALWHDLLLYVDEAHELAPEPGHGVESRDEKLCRHALIDFAAKGRKRGYGTVAATQRLGKLSKDFAAELKNILVGQTFIDIDRERAAGSLGIGKAEKPEFFKAVKLLDPGTFYALGRAFTLDTTLVKIGDVETEHPEAGRRQSAAPPPTQKIRHLLPQLADLPKEAEDKVRTEKELITEIERLKKSDTAPALEREVLRLRVELERATEKNEKRATKSVLKESDIKRLEKLVARAERNETALIGQVAMLAEKVAEPTGARQKLIGEVAALTHILRDTDSRRTHGAVPGPTWTNDVPPKLVPPLASNTRKIRAEAPGRRETDQGDGDSDHMPEKCQKMLGALRQGEAMGQASMLFRTVAVIAGVAPTSGTTGNRKGFLKNGGYMTVQGDRVQLTEKGRSYPLNVSLPPTDRDELLEFWKREIGTEKIAAMLDFVVRNGSATDDELAEAAGMAKSGTFGNYKGALVGRGLMVKVSSGQYEPAEAFTR